jgi:carotenoid 1,2-hydratase
LSDDGRHGITLIGFVGSVFSPYYAWARRRGNPDPNHHCAINVALYGDMKRWAMTERGRGDLARDTHHLTIGPSSLSWDGQALTVTIDETTAPIPSKLRGQVRLTPHCLTDYSFALDGQGLHQWRPIAPSARVEVDLEQPGLRWQGPGYLDSNRGEEPVEKGFRYWDWSRAVMENQETLVLYEADRRDGGHSLLALRFDADGKAREVEPPPAHTLPTARIWRAPRATRADTGSAVIRHTFEDTPFYARSLLDARIHGEKAVAFHESLSLDRFDNPVVRLMLPFRMPRRARG